MFQNFSESWAGVLKRGAGAESEKSDSLHL